MSKSLECFKLFKKGYSYNQIAKILECSKGTISYHLRIHKQQQLEKRVNNKNLLLTQILSENFSGKEEFLLKYSGQLTKREITYICRNKFPIFAAPISKYYYRDRRRAYKQALVDSKGGKCSVCGYNKCLKSLQFHHTIPGEKDFNISGVSWGKFEEIRKELDKCILVCANCHGEIHDK